MVKAKKTTSKAKPKAAAKPVVDKVKTEAPVGAIKNVTASGPGVDVAKARGPEGVENLLKKQDEERAAEIAKANDSPPMTLEEEFIEAANAGPPIAGLTAPQKAELAKVDADIEAKHREMEEGVKPVKSDLPFLENDPLNADARDAAKIDADRLFEKGVAEAAFEEQPFVEPSLEEIQAEVLGNIETARHEHRQRGDAFAALVPDKPMPRTAESASRKARQREG